VLRVSSDLSRVKVRRIDPVTKKLREMQFDYASSRQPYEARTDLFLRDGDVVEVPEK
jgi:cell division septal protein FtsQ